MRSRLPTRASSLNGRGFTIVQLVMGIAIGLTLLAVTIPPFLQMIRRARTVEAVEQLAAIYRGSVAYYTGTRPTQSLAPVIPPREFPASVAVTPTAVPLGTRVRDPEGT